MLDFTNPARNFLRRVRNGSIAKYNINIGNPLLKPQRHSFSGHHSRSKYLIRDNDEIYQPSFDEVLFTTGVKTVQIAPHSPDLNAFAERWVRSVKTECLRRVRCVGIGGRQRALREYLIHYHQKRNHQGIGNVVIAPEKLVADPAVPIRCRSRLGGVLKHYYRAA